MRVRNIHARELCTTTARAGALIDSLSSPGDALWPSHSWPRMVFDRPLGVGAAGGHGPIRYFVEAYVPGKSIRFRFTAPKGFDGYHEFEICETGPSGCVLRHNLEMTARGSAAFSWTLAIRHLHDALLEDSLAQAQASLGQSPRVRKWSAWVKMVRWAISTGTAQAQRMPAVCGDRRSAG